MSYYTPSYISVTPQHVYQDAYSIAYYDSNVIAGYGSGGYGAYNYGAGTVSTASGLAYNPTPATGGGSSAGGLGGLLSGIGQGVGNALQGAGFGQPQILTRAPATAGLITLLVIAGVVMALASRK